MHMNKQKYFESYSCIHIHNTMLLWLAFHKPVYVITHFHCGKASEFYLNAAAKQVNSYCITHLFSSVIQFSNIPYTLNLSQMVLCLMMI